MSIIVSLSSEIETRLREKAIQQGQDASLVAAELLARILDWEVQDSEEAVADIQQGLDDFEAGRSRSFQDFAEEQQG
jgi:predicted transcriptional regulator